MPKTELAINDSIALPETEITVGETDDVEEQTPLIPPTIDEVFELVETQRELSSIQNLTHHFIKFFIPNEAVKVAFPNVDIDRVLDTVFSGDKVLKYIADPNEYIKDRVEVESTIRENPSAAGFIDAMQFGVLQDNNEVVSLETKKDMNESGGNMVGGLVRDVALGTVVPGGFITATTIGSGMSTYNEEMGAGSDTQSAMKLGMTSAVAHGAGAYIGLKFVPFAMGLAQKSANRMLSTGIARYGANAVTPEAAAAVSEAGGQTTKILSSTLNYLQSSKLVSAGVAANTAGLEFVGWDASSFYLDRLMRDSLDLPSLGGQYNMYDAMRSYGTGLGFKGATSLLGSVFKASIGGLVKVKDKVDDKKIVNMIYENMESVESGYVMTGNDVKEVADAVREAIRNNSENLASLDIFIKVLETNVDGKARSKVNIDKILTELKDVM